MVLAELPSGITHRLKSHGDGGSLGGKADRRASLTYRRHSSANGQLTSDEVRAASRAARFGVIVGEHHSLGGELVDVGSLSRHHSPVISAHVEPANVVAHDEENIRFFCLR